MFFKSTLAAVLLACGAVAVPQGKAILGYRTVDPAEAAAINRGGTVSYDPAKNTGAKQIGPGVYTSPSPGEWPGEEGDWFCVIYADATLLDGVGNSVNKIWIPKFYYFGSQKRDLWFTGDDVVRSYIKGYGGYDWDPDYALRMALNRGSEPKVQLLIPPKVLSENKLKITATCRPSVDTLPDQAAVNYVWNYNLGGDKNPPPSQDTGSDSD